ncbi:ExbD/TolR family protein [Aurantiacibacter gilvus]|uniref:Biopolymer transporter ExbD n=1 Tax=Aurantiacibacter gilvus TaxID=3139141 RepID=A0ABU9IGZ1_9SPHN
MAMSGGSDDGEPMMDMNMTPLIDVLLVLLIMFIITIPVATHAINIDLPSPDPNPPPEDQIDPIKNKIVLTQGGQILWNATAINEGELVRNLQETLTFSVEPELQFEPEEYAAYDTAARVLDIIKTSGVTKFGFVGNERYRVFDCGGCPPLEDREEN